MTPSEVSPTEQAAKVAADLDCIGPSAVVRLMVADASAVTDAFRRAEPYVASLAEAATTAIAGGGRIIFVGAGTSGRLGVLEAAECPPTFSATPGQVMGLMAGGPSAVVQAVEGAEDDADAGAKAIEAEAVGPADLVVGIAASGRTPYVRGALHAARTAGATTGIVTSNPAVALETPPPADTIVVMDTGPEILTGSTRLKAGSAAKLVLNAVTTAAFASTGKVYQNLMVDLMATNAKLRGRTLRILSKLTGLENIAAAAAMAAAGGRLKEAVVMVRSGDTCEEASARLERLGGCLRRALDEGAVR